MRFIRTISLILLCFQVCLAQTPTTGQNVEGFLVGTWLQVSTSESIGGKETPVAPMEITWKFEPGGRGVFSQRISLSAQPWSSPIGWRLEEGVLLLDGGRSKYTIVQKTDNAMIWRNEDSGSFYHVRRFSD